MTVRAIASNIESTSTPLLVVQGFNRVKPHSFEGKKKSRVGCPRAKESQTRWPSHPSTRAEIRRPHDWTQSEKLETHHSMSIVPEPVCTSTGTPPPRTLP